MSAKAWLLFGTVIAHKRTVRSPLAALTVMVSPSKASITTPRKVVAEAELPKAIPVERMAKRVKKRGSFIDGTSVVKFISGCRGYWVSGAAKGQLTRRCIRVSKRSAVFNVQSLASWILLLVIPSLTLWGIAILSPCQCILLWCAGLLGVYQLFPRSGIN